MSKALLLIMKNTSFISILDKLILKENMYLLIYFFLIIENVREKIQLWSHEILPERVGKGSFGDLFP